MNENNEFQQALVGDLFKMKIAIIADNRRQFNLFIKNIYCKDIFIYVHETKDALGENICGYINIGILDYEEIINQLKIRSATRAKYVTRWCLSDCTIIRRKKMVQRAIKVNG